MALDAGGRGVGVGGVRVGVFVWARGFRQAGRAGKLQVRRMFPAPIRRFREEFACCAAPLKRTDACNICVQLLGGL